MAFNLSGVKTRILWIWIIWSQKLQFQFLGSHLDTLRGQMVFSIKIFVFWSLIGCKIAIFGTIFRLRNWFGDSNANCHFTTEICMFVPSNLYMKSKKVSYNCFFLFFSWKRMEKLKNIYLMYKFIIGCPLLSSHPVEVFKKILKVPRKEEK